MSVMPKRRIFPPIYWLFSLILMFVLDRYIPGPALFSGKWKWYWFGLVPVMLGVWLLLTAFFLFRRSGTEVIPFRPSSALVITGPYIFSRNPMYLGMALILSGVWLLLNSGTPVVVIPLFISVIQYRFILDEEKVMQTQFGEAYRRYCRQTRRWL